MFSWVDSLFSWVDFSGYFIPPQEYSPHRSIGRRGTRAVLPTANSRSCKASNRCCLSNFHYQCPLIKPCTMEVKRVFFSFTDRARTAAPARLLIFRAANVRPLLMGAALGFEQKSTPTACGCLLV